MNGAVIIWRDEFASQLELSTDETPQRWRTRGCDDGGSLSQGYKDYAGSSWNISPIEHPNHTPFKVENGVLTITAKRNPGLEGVDAPWIGGILVSDPNAGHSFTYGYFEIRMRLPNSGPGMFPALWFFSNAADPSTVAGPSTSSKRSAEIDLFEVFGNPDGMPWMSTLRRRPNPGSDQSAGSHNEETRDWHRYGLEWTPDAIRFYRDGALRREVTGDSASWFQDVPMGIRLNYAMDPAWAGSTRSTATDPHPGTELRMEIDYVRHYDRKPIALATGSADPESVVPSPPDPPYPSPMVTPRGIPASNCVTPREANMDSRPTMFVERMKTVTSSAANFSARFSVARHVQAELARERRLSSPFSQRPRAHTTER